MYPSNFYGVFGVSAAATAYRQVLREIIAPAVEGWKGKMRAKYPSIDEMMVCIPINEDTPITLQQFKQQLRRLQQFMENVL